MELQCVGNDSPPARVLHVPTDIVFLIQIRKSHSSLKYQPTGGGGGAKAMGLELLMVVGRWLKIRPWQDRMVKASL